MVGYQSNVACQQESNKDALYLLCYIFLFKKIYKIQNNPNIEVISVNIADDLTVDVKDDNSLLNTINAIYEFSRHVGCKINIDKTECILLGTLKDTFKE